MITTPLIMKKTHKKQQRDSRNTSTSTTNLDLKSEEENEGDNVGSKTNLLEKTEEYEFKSPVKGAGSTLSDKAYNQVCKDLVEGYSITAVAQRNCLGRQSVVNIKENIRDRIPNWKQSTSRKMGDLITQLMGSLEEDLINGRLNPDRKSIHICILSQRKQEIDGDKNITITHRKEPSNNDFHQKMDAYLNSLKNVTGSTQQTDGLVQSDHKPLIINDVPGDCTDSAQIGVEGDQEVSEPEHTETDSCSQKNSTKRTE